MLRLPGMLLLPTGLREDDVRSVLCTCCRHCCCRCGHILLLMIISSWILNPSPNHFELFAGSARCLLHPIFFRKHRVRRRLPTTSSAVSGCFRRQPCKSRLRCFCVDVITIVESERNNLIRRGTSTVVVKFQMNHAMRSPPSSLDFRVGMDHTWRSYGNMFGNHTPSLACIVGGGADTGACAIAGLVLRRERDDVDGACSDT